MIIMINKWVILLMLSISGGMMTLTANAVPTFKLKAPSEYFTDTRSLALLNAALIGDTTKVKQLIAEGANPNDEGPLDKPNRLRLLHYAIAADNTQAVKILMASGADPEMVVKGFGRALLFAMTLDNIEMLSLMLDLKPITSLSNDTIETLLFESIFKPRPRCLAVLLQHGAPIDFRDAAGYTILMRASNAGDFDLMEWLIQKGASVNIETTNGVTPAYSIQDKLARIQPGSESHQKLLRIKKLMEEKGAVFPALSPEEVRAKREY